MTSEEKNKEVAEKLVCECSDDGKGRFFDSSATKKDLRVSYEDHHDTCPLYNTDGQQLVENFCLALTQRDREHESLVKRLREAVENRACELEWKCENPECGVVYAEYVNGCPRCATGEVGGSYSVIGQAVPAHKILLAFDNKLAELTKEGK